MVKKLSGCQSLGRDDVKTRHKKELAFFGDVWRQWRGNSRHNVTDDFLEVLSQSRPRRLPCQHLNQSTPETPNVCALVMTGPFEYLRSHVIRSTFERGAELGNVLIGLDFHLLGSSKVSNFDDSILANQYIGALQVPVDDRHRMQVIESFQNLPTKSRSFHLTNFSFFRQVIFETALMNQLKNYFYSFIVQTDIKTEVFDNVGVVKLF